MIYVYYAQVFFSRNYSSYYYICRIPSICFPCTYKLDISPEAKEILTQIEEKKEQLLIIEENIEKATKYRQKFLQKFKDKEKKYNNLMDKTEKFEQRPLED